MQNISYVTYIPFPAAKIGEGKIYRSPEPRLEQLRYFKNSLAINTIVQLFDGYMVEKEYKRKNFNIIIFPIKDFNAPTNYKETLMLVDSILQKTNEGKNVVIHCISGKGRTGLILACIARRVFGFSGQESISWVRNYIPGAVEAPAQKEFVDIFLEKNQLITHAICPSPNSKNF